jgi:hypothetical protein
MIGQFQVYYFYLSKRGMLYLLPDAKKRLRYLYLLNLGETPFQLFQALLIGF